MAGEGTQAPPNPWAQYGLNADGTPAAEKPAGENKPDPVAAELAAVKTKLADAEAKLAKLPEDFDGLNKKLGVVDKLVKALGADAGEPTDPKTQEVWDDLKNVAKRTAPGVHKLLVMLEKDPDALDKLSGGVDALAGSRLEQINVQAHDTVIDKAKKIFKGYTAEELNAAVLPYEKVMNEMIQSNPAYLRKYVRGDLSFLGQMFDDLHKPHVSARLREKQARMEKPATTAPPRGAGAPSAGEDDKPKSRDFSPKGKQAFMKNAVARWMDKGRNDD